MQPHRPDTPRAGWWKTHWQFARLHAHEPAALQGGVVEPGLRLAYGLAQPLLGLRLLLRDKELRKQAFLPVLIVGLICTIIAWKGGDGDLWQSIGLWWASFFGLAPLPPLLFAKSYAKMAAQKRNELGFGPCEPYLKSWWEIGKEWFAQLFILALGIAPLTFMVALLPAVGDVVATVLAAAWTFHWMMVEGLDAAKTRCAPEIGPERPETPPWFLRWLMLPMPAWASLPLLPTRVMARLVAVMAKQWGPELRIIERSPWESVGFGLGTVVMLSVPGLNLLFRPAVVLGGAHLRSRLELASRSDAAPHEDEAVRNADR